MIDKEKYNLLEIKIEEAIKSSGRLLTYIGTWDLCNGSPTAVFVDTKPTTKFKYYLISKNAKQEVTEEEMSRFSIVAGIKCPYCEEIIYSPVFDSKQFCNCKKSWIEGGPYRPMANADSIPTNINMLSKWKDKKDEN